MHAPLHHSERTTSDLRFCREQFESIRSDVHEFAVGLNAAQLAWRPDSSTWSVGQCLEYLNTTTAVDRRRIEALVAIARARNRFRLPLVGRSESPVLRLNDETRATLATGAAIEPPPTPDLERLVDRFSEQNEALLALIDRAGDVATAADATAGGAVLLDMIGHTLQLNALHHWRFILQARRLMERPGFPRR